MSLAVAHSLSSPLLVVKIDDGLALSLVRPFTLSRQLSISRMWHVWWSLERERPRLFARLARIPEVDEDVVERAPADAANSSVAMNTQRRRVTADNNIRVVRNKRYVYMLPLISFDIVDYVKVCSCGLCRYIR